MYLYAGAKFTYEEALLRQAFCFFEEVPRFPVTHTYLPTKIAWVARHIIFAVGSQYCFFIRGFRKTSF
jgi:hypothetical protein